MNARNRTKRTNTITARNADRARSGGMTARPSIDELRRQALELANDHPMLGVNTYDRTTRPGGGSAVPLGRGVR